MLVQLTVANKGNLLTYLATHFIVQLVMGICGV